VRLKAAPATGTPRVRECSNDVTAAMTHARAGLKDLESVEKFDSFLNKSTAAGLPSIGHYTSPIPG
jgi:hypothetical protein